MEDYEYRVINLQATLFQIISKSTSKNQPEPPIGVYIGGGHGGAEPPYEASPRLVFPPPIVGRSWTLFPEIVLRGQTQKGNPSGVFPE